jgi:hypothetical protein
MSKLRKDLTGNIFGCLRVVRFAGQLVPKNRKSYYECICDACGKTVFMASDNLSRPAKNKSCGCLKGKSSVETHTKHGMSKTPTYKCWCEMLYRCHNPNSDCYERYGGRGIGVNKRWLKFENFLSDMGERPPGKTLDRIDNNGDYSPDNCRWATPKEQSLNRRSNVKIEYQGETRSISEWAKITRLPRQTIEHRLKANWTLQEILETPAYGRKIQKDI